MSTLSQSHVDFGVMLMAFRAIRFLGLLSQGLKELSVFGNLLKLVRSADKLPIHKNLRDLWRPGFPIKLNGQLGVVPNVLSFVRHAELTENGERLLAVWTSEYGVDGNPIIVVDHDFLSGTWTVMGCVSFSDSMTMS